jgi:hypothetical protein
VEGNIRDADCWERVYREKNAAAEKAAAETAEKARVEAERQERLKAEMPTVAAARGWVMRQCGFAPSRRGRGVEQVIEAVLAQDQAGGALLCDVASKMAEAWRRYQANGEYLRVHYGPVKFFRLSIWRDERGWSWDEAKLELRNGARV